MKGPTQRKSNLKRKMRKMRRILWDHNPHCRKCGILTVWPVPGVEKVEPNYASLEHIIPLKEGGPNELSNTTLFCHHCNLETAAQRAKAQRHVQQERVD